MRGLAPRRPRVVRGRRAVELSLVEAATRLFEVRSPASVTVREIAEEAGVNHGLVHHYFGSKQGLLTAVLADLARKADGTGASQAGLRPGSPISRYVLVASRVLLDAEEPATSELAGELVARLRLLAQELPHRGAGGGTRGPGANGDHDPGRGTVTGREAPRPEAPQEGIQAAQAAALAMGWLVFEPFLLSAVGLGTTDADVAQARAVLERSARLVGPHESG